LTRAAGSQILDYLPTQAMADFLATAVDPPLDGIIYRSAQDGHLDPDRRIFGGSGYKRNVILFQRSARVQQLDKGAKIAVSDDSLYSWASLFDDAPIFDDGPNLKYWVTVSSDAPSYEPDDAPLKLSTLEVHYVKGVKFDTSSSPVSRYYRAEEPEPK
jgi:hypothetical protein